MNIKKMLILLLLLPVDFFAQDFTTSQNFPILYSSGDSMLAQLNGTVWVTVDTRRNEDLYAFFVDKKYGSSAVERGCEATAPQRMFPIKFMQRGPMPNTGIFMVASQDRILYYAFTFLSPIYLVISAGYEDITPLLVNDISYHLSNGYLLTLVQ